LNPIWRHPRPRSPGGGRRGRRPGRRETAGVCFFLWLFAASLPVFPGPSQPSEATPLLAPNDAKGLQEPLYHQAVVYLLRFRPDDLGQSVRLFNQILKFDKEFAPAYGGLAEARALRYLWSWDPDPARMKQGLEEGRQGVELAPALAETRLGLGLAYMAAERYTPALAELDRAVSLDAGSFRAHLYRGMVLRGLRRNDDLAKEAAVLIKIDPSAATAHALLGDYYQEVKDFTAARQAYLTGAMLDQKLLWPRLGLAASYQRGRNYSAAAKTYDATEVDFPEEISRTRIMAASLLVATQNYEDALKVYETVEKDPVSPPLLRRLMLAGRAYSLEKLGGPEKAEFYWTRLVEEFPSDFDGAMRDREVFSQGFEALFRYYEQKGDRKKASSLLSRACRGEGMSFVLYRSLAARQIAAGDARAAVATLRRGIHGAPPGLDMVSASEAPLAIWRSRAARRPSSAEARDRLQLLEELEARLSREPSSSYVPYLNLARSEALLGRETEALALLRQAVDKGFTGIRDAAKDADFNSLSRNPDFRELTARP
jgi:tetratricopeptide (TPR) repeat protein